MILRPFWRYFGGKWSAAPRYPFPLHATIIEPFAGSASYSLRYPARRVILVERYAVIAGIWRFLIAASAAEIRAIPTWFVDPPYQRMGKHCIHGSDEIDYLKLGEWCRTRRGQVIACDDETATWLPFRAFGETTGVAGKRSREAMWTTHESQLVIPLR